MTEEPTARERLLAMWGEPDWWFIDHSESGDVLNFILSQLPLVLEAAREAGKVKQGMKPIPDFGTATVPNLGSVSSGWWFLIPSGAEPTPEEKP